MEYRERKVDDMIHEYLAKSESLAWKQVTIYKQAVTAQQKGLQRANRRIHRLRELLIANNINPDNGPSKYTLLKDVPYVGDVLVPNGK